MKPLLNSKAVCGILGVSAAVLSRMVHANRIPFVLLSTGKKKMTVRFKEEELEAWVTRRSRGAAPKLRKNDAAEMLSTSTSNLKDVDKKNGDGVQVIENAATPLVLETGGGNNSTHKGEPFLSTSSLRRDT